MESQKSSTLSEPLVPSIKSSPHAVCAKSCSIKDGELCCLSGALLQIPCIDWYAPNASYCCCYTPHYNETIYEANDFYQRVLPKLHTGDIALFSWPLENQFGTQVSRCMSHSRWSHNGMIYRPSDRPDILKNRDWMFPDDVHSTRPLLFHAIASGECGARQMEEGGTDLLDFEVFARDYLDKFSHCTLEVAENVEDIGIHIVGVRRLQNINRDDAFYHAVEKTVKEFRGRPFEPTVSWNMIKAQIDTCEQVFCCCRATEDTSHLFCTMLVAEVYKAAKLVDPSLITNEFIPAMFDTTRRLQLQNGVSLSCEEVLLGPATWAEREQMDYPEKQNPSIRYNRGDQVEGFGSGGFWNVDASQPIDHDYVPRQALSQVEIRRSRIETMTSKLSEAPRRIRISTNLDGWRYTNFDGWH